MLFFGPDSTCLFTINLSNGIIGVSVLAMSFCLNQCGLILGFLMLTFSALLTRSSCDLLMSGSYLCQKNSYEQYSQYIMGPYLRTFTEICMILYTKSTLIAFFVVIGDLGESIFGMEKITEIDDTETFSQFRMIFVVCFAFLIILPLCLLHNIRSLSIISSLAMLFYGFLILRLIFLAWPNLIDSDVWQKIHYWRWQGVLKCIPIFSMSLSCQTQLFIISAEVPHCTPAKMDQIVKWAILLCSSVYFCVGFFGYVAFYNVPIPGDIMVLLGSTMSSQIVKFGFIMSVAVSYPIMVFPCRAAIFSLYCSFERYFILGEKSRLIDSRHPSPKTLRLITVFLIIFSVYIALMVPNMELILGLSGSLIGSIICFIIPAILFIKCMKTSLIGQKLFDTTKLSLISAKVCLIFGISMLFFSTYVTLMDHSNEHEENLFTTNDDLDQLTLNEIENPVITTTGLILSAGIESLQQILNNETIKTI